MQEHVLAIAVGDVLPNGNVAAAGDIKAEQVIVCEQQPFFGAQNTITLDQAMEACRILN